MENRYKFYIVIDGNEHAILMSKDYAGEEEAQQFMKQTDIKFLWVGLENGDMVAVSSLTGSVYFKAKRVN